MRLHLPLTFLGNPLDDVGDVVGRTIRRQPAAVVPRRLPVTAKVDGEDWTDDQVEAFGQNVVDRIEEYAPGFRDRILHMEVRTPRELENEIGLTAGNIFHGELTMDQLSFNRPLPGHAQYRGPVKGLYLCGSSSHPGGGVMAAPGANAAREILGDLRRINTVPEGWLDD